MSSVRVRLGPPRAARTGVAYWEQVHERDTHAEKHQDAGSHSRLKKPKRPSRLGVYDDRSGSLARHAPPQGRRAVWIYFFAINEYFPLSPDSLSSQMTVHLPESANFAFTAPFFVSYTAHTSSLFSETLHS